jgi:ubiquinone/menaquinone biosynthesis C-methylase UbiE
MSHFTYIGKELATFAKATNWKNYIKSLINEFIQGYVLEVGAGIGSNTTILLNSQYCKWLCLEPDERLLQSLMLVLNSSEFINHQAQHGTIDVLGEGQKFDSILYIDVLEHIYMDSEELIEATRILNNNGKLVILSPAHQCLFSPFDSAIGHYRRYNKLTLRKILPDDIEIVKLVYLDCVGLLASIINKSVLRQSTPSLKQIWLWDRFIVPISMMLDSFFHYRIGKSILLIGRKVA